MPKKRIKKSADEKIDPKLGIDGTDQRTSSFSDELIEELQKTLEIPRQYIEKKQNLHNDPFKENGPKKHPGEKIITDFSNENPKNAKVERAIKFINNPQKDSAEKEIIKVSEEEETIGFINNPQKESVEKEIIDVIEDARQNIKTRNLKDASIKINEAMEAISQLGAKEREIVDVIEDAIQDVKSDDFVGASTKLSQVMETLSDLSTTKIVKRPIIDTSQILLLSKNLIKRFHVPRVLRNNLEIVIPLIIGVIIFLPRTSHMTGYDAYYVVYQAQLINAGYLLDWLIHPFSIFGLFPFSGYPIGTPLIISMLLILCNNNVDQSVFVYSLLIMFCSTLSSTLLLKQFTKDKTSILMGNILYTLTPTLYEFAYFTATARMMIFVLAPLQLYYLFQWQKSNKKKDLFLLLSITFISFLFHRFSMPLTVFMVVGITCKYLFKGWKKLAHKSPQFSLQVLKSVLIFAILFFLNVILIFSFFTNFQATTKNDLGEVPFLSSLPAGLINYLNFFFGYFMFYGPVLFLIIFGILLFMQHFWNIRFSNFKERNVSTGFFPEQEEQSSGKLLEITFQQTYEISLKNLPLEVQQQYPVKFKIYEQNYKKFGDGRIRMYHTESNGEEDKELREMVQYKISSGISFKSSIDIEDSLKYLTLFALIFTMSPFIFNYAYSRHLLIPILLPFSIYPIKQLLNRKYILQLLLSVSYISIFAFYLLFNLFWEDINNYFSLITLLFLLFLVYSFLGLFHQVSSYLNQRSTQGMITMKNEVIRVNNKIRISNLYKKFRSNNRNIGISLLLLLVIFNSTILFDIRHILNNEESFPYPYISDEEVEIANYIKTSIKDLSLPYYTLCATHHLNEIRIGTYAGILVLSDTHQINLIIAGYLNQSEIIQNSGLTLPNHWIERTVYEYDPGHYYWRSKTFWRVLLQNPYNSTDSQDIIHQFNIAFFVKLKESNTSYFRLGDIFESPFAETIPENLIVYETNHLSLYQLPIS